jgi:predicted TIM-barrel fold metal-dependent hydrolase
VVFAPFHSDYGRANAQVAAIVRRHPKELIGFAFIHTTRDAGRIGSMVEQAVGQWNFRGIKVHGRDAMPTRELCDVAMAFKLPILVDVIGKAHVVDMFAPQYPGVNFIIPHLGSFGGDFRAHQQVIDQMVRYPNVYGDSSNVYRFDYLVQAIRRAGPRKLLFGSDGPWLHPAVELLKIRLLRLPPAAAALVLGGNILRLMGMQPAAESAALKEYSIQ